MEFTGLVKEHFALAKRDDLTVSGTYQAFLVGVHYLPEIVRFTLGNEILFKFEVVYRNYLAYVY